MQLSLFGDATQCDRDEAPDGYYAILKSSVPQDKGNLCQFCDWRKQCNDDEIDKLAPGHRCMGYPVRAYRDGKIYERKDKCSVVFRDRSLDEAMIPDRIGFESA